MKCCWYSFFRMRVMFACRRKEVGCVIMKEAAYFLLALYTFNWSKGSNVNVDCFVLVYFLQLESILETEGNGNSYEQNYRRRVTSHPLAGHLQSPRHNTHSIPVSLVAIYTCGKQIRGNQMHTWHTERFFQQLRKEVEGREGRDNETKAVQCVAQRVDVHDDWSDFFKRNGNNFFSCGHTRLITWCTMGK